jgi:uncharacterized membrane protein YbhN (UPF0104 family)
MKKFLLLTIITLTAFTPFITSAIDTGLDTTANEAGLTKMELVEIIGNIVYIVLGLLGVIFILLLIYGGFMRMTAQGDPTKITKSTGIITSATIGVAIILASFTITAFILSRVKTSVGIDAQPTTNTQINSPSTTE